MKIEVRTIGDVKIMDCSGKIVLGEGTVAVRNKVQDLLQSGSKKLILNLADVNYVDSGGIGELVRNHITAINNGGRMKLLNLTKKIEQLLVIAKLETVFDTFDNEKAAIESF